MTIKSEDFESTASTIPPPEHLFKGSTKAYRFIFVNTKMFYFFSFS